MDNKATAGIPWRCERCGSTIAIVRDGGCEVPAGASVELRETSVIVTCVVCRSPNVWALDKKTSRLFGAGWLVS